MKNIHWSESVQGVAWVDVCFIEEMSKQTQNVDHSPEVGWILLKGYVDIINHHANHTDTIKDNNNGMTTVF